jgi:hypothetical protein
MKVPLTVTLLSATEAAQYEAEGLNRSVSSFRAESKHKFVPDILAQVSLVIRYSIYPAVEPYPLVEPN